MSDPDLAEMDPPIDDAEGGVEDTIAVVRSVSVGIAPIAIRCEPVTVDAALLAPWLRRPWAVPPP